MSKRDRDRNPHLPPGSRIPFNLAGIATLEIEKLTEGELAEILP